MDTIFTIFMNSENSKTSKPHALILKFTNKSDLRIAENIIAQSNLNIYYKWKNIKSSYNNNKFKISTQHGMINFNYQMDHILCQTFKIILSIF